MSHSAIYITCKQVSVCLLFVFYEKLNLQGFHGTESSENQKNVTIVESLEPASRCFRRQEPGEQQTCDPMIKVVLSSREQHQEARSKMQIGLFCP